MKQKQVIGIGETVFDILFKEGQPRKGVPGGSTLNSIVSLGKAGVPCAMVTETGGDQVGDIICDFLTANGVSTAFVCRHKEAKSNISLAFLDANNDAHYEFYRDPAGVALDGPLPHFEQGDVVLFGSFFAINPAIRPVVGAMLTSAHEAGAWLYYDVNFRKNHLGDLPQVKPLIEENMRLADVVRGSMEDFQFIYGLHEGDAIYRQVGRYCSKLILTDGPRPIRVYTPDGCQAFPVEEIEAVSTVGAGDNFNAGYIYAMMHDMNDEQLRIAMAQRWSQDVCKRLENSISDELAMHLTSTPLS